MIVYTPLDIELTLPNYNEILKYVEENYVIGLEKHTGYTSWLCPIATPFAANDYRNASEVFPPNDLAEFKKMNYVPGILDKFPELVDIINAMPYSTLYGVSFNLHKAPLGAHHDRALDLTPHDMPRINILISPHYGKSSFFMQDSNDGNRIYPTILKDYPAYAFNDTRMLHGADPVLDNRIIIIFVGILDKTKYSELVERSVNKFKKYIIEV